MKEKCTHETSITEYAFKGFGVSRCTRGCGQHLIEVELGNHTVKTYTAAELATLTARLSAAEKALRDAQRELRSSSMNWQEQCFFDADEIISAALKES